jgi:phosphatidylinositol-3-phosphatase
MSKGRLICRSLTIVFSAVCVLFTQAGCGGGAGVRTDPPPGTGQIPVVAHVFVLVEENHAFESVIGNASMPYTNSLAQRYGLATQYFANRHNSLPNYFMLTVGDLVTTNDLFTGTVTSDNVVRALTAAGKSWKIYAESLPSTGYLGPTAVPYSKDHNPFAYISDVLNSSSQTANIVSFTELATDLKNGTLPDYAMILPNAANDGHDCPNEASSCTDTQKLANIDQWIKNNVGPLINSIASQNSVLIYTWDESNVNDLANGGGHVATILVGAHVRAGFQSTTMYQHQSTLKLTMQLLGITDFPGAAATAPDMAEFF